MRQITHIVIHCSATPNGSPVGIEDIDRWHRERGWRKVGYHYVIELDGALMTGRQVSEIGAHVAGSNAKSIGICMVGTDRFTPEQWATLRDIVSSLKDQFPAAQVCGHRDFSPDQNGDGVLEPWEWLKTCPGFSVADWMSGGMDALPEAVLA